jgi:flagellar assembly protein FliH
MPLSSRLTRREHVATSAPYRLDAIHETGKAGSLRANGHESEAKRDRERTFQEGFRAGEAAARALAERERIRLDSILASHDREMGRLNEDLARAVIALAVDVAKHVTRTHVAVREDAVLPVIRDALSFIREDASPSRLYLSFDDAALVERDIGAELAQRGCRIVPEPALGPGECRLEGSHALVDATLATRWRKAIAPLGETRDWLD